MNRTLFLSALSASTAALLMSAGAAGAATLPFAADCDPILSSAIGNPNPAAAPWFITFEQRNAGGTCVLADIYKNASQNAKLGVGDSISTLKFNGYGIDFRPTTQGSLPKLVSDTLDPGYITDGGDGRISMVLANDANLFNLLSFRYAIGSASGLNVLVTFASGLTALRTFDTDPDAQGGFVDLASAFSFGADRIAGIDWSITGTPTVLRLDALTFSTTIPGSGGGGPGEVPGDGGGTVPEPSSIALLALAGGLAAIRRRRSDD